MAVYGATCPGWCSAGHATTPQGPPPPRAQCQQGQTRQHTQAAPDAPQQCTRGGSRYDSAGACGQSRPHAQPRHHRLHPARQAQAGCSRQYSCTTRPPPRSTPRPSVPGPVGKTSVRSHSKLARRRHLPIWADTDDTHAACMCHADTVPRPAHHQRQIARSQHPRHDDPAPRHARPGRRAPRTPQLARPRRLRLRHVRSRHTAHCPDGRRPTP